MYEESTARGFGEVDRAARPETFVRYLDTVTGLEAVQAYKRRSYDLLHLRAGNHVLDVGCGTGDDVRAMASKVGPSGRAVGIDSSEVMVTEAKKRSAGLGLPVEFRKGTATELPFENGAFDATRSERVFQHLKDPKATLREMVRVTRPGGRVAVIDPDWETMVIDSADRRVTRRILSASLEGHVNPCVGRQLFSLFHTLGLRRAEVLAVTVPLLTLSIAEPILELHGSVSKAVELGAISLEEGSRWLSELEERDRAGSFFSSLTGFGLFGTKP